MRKAPPRRDSMFKMLGFYLKAAQRTDRAREIALKAITAARDKAKFDSPKPAPAR